VERRLAEPGPDGGRGIAAGLREREKGTRLGQGHARAGDHPHRRLDSVGQHQAGFGRDHSARHPFEQGQADLPLELPQRLGHRGLSQIDQPRRAGDAAAAHGRGGCAQMAKVERVRIH
jgi:hypothetical protein